MVVVEVIPAYLPKSPQFLPLVTSCFRGASRSQILSTCTWQYSYQGENGRRNPPVVNSLGLGQRFGSSPESAGIKTLINGQILLASFVVSRLF